MHLQFERLLDSWEMEADPDKQVVNLQFAQGGTVVRVWLTKDQMSLFLEDLQLTIKELEDDVGDPKGSSEGEVGEDSSGEGS